VTLVAVIEHLGSPDNLLQETLAAPAGSLVFFDSALWHRVGEPTAHSRWSVFNMYGPWFMKPYFRFTDNYDAAAAEQLSPAIRRVLHFNSIPPKDERAGTATVRK